MSGEVKFCRKCGTKVPADSRFCPKCGNEFSVPVQETSDSRLSGVSFCPGCGRENSAGAVFCRYCGRSLKGAPAGTGRPAQKISGRPVRTAAQKTAQNTHPVSQPARPGTRPQSNRKNSGRRTLPVILLAAVLALAAVALLVIFRPGKDRPGLSGQGEGPLAGVFGNPESGSSSAENTGKEPADVWQLTEEQMEEYARLSEMPEPETPVQWAPADLPAWDNYDWLFGDPEGWMDPEETGTGEDTAESAESGKQEAKSPAFSVNPTEGVTISGEENALDHERDFTMTEVEDEEFENLMAGLEQIDPMGAVLNAWELDAGLADDELLPGFFTMSFDLSKLDIDQDLYDTICAYRVDDAGNWYPYAGELDGSVLKIQSSQNSTLVIVSLILLPFLPDIGTTFQGISSGAVYDPRAKSFYVEVDGKRTFQILVEEGDLTARMEEASEKQLEEARKKAREEAKRRYRKALDWSEDLADSLDYTGKQFYRIYIACLKEELQKNDIPAKYRNELEALKNNEIMLKALSPVNMVIEQSREAYRYLRDNTGTKLPSYIIRLEISDADRPAYGVTVNSYTFTRNHYMVLYLKKFENGSTQSKEQLLLTLVHELFHIIQREYKSPYTANFKFDEASAQTVESEAYDYFHEKGMITTDKAALLENLAAIDFFAIPMDKLSTGSYPEGAVNVGDAKSADISYPFAEFLYYMRKERSSATWGEILRLYGLQGVRPSVSTILKSGFMLTDQMLTERYLDFANYAQNKLFMRAYSQGRDNPGAVPVTMLVPGGKTGVDLVNRDYVIRTRPLRFRAWDEENKFAIVLKKREGFDDVMSDFRIIPVGLQKDKDWKEWSGGIFVEAKHHFRVSPEMLACMFVEADGGTAEKTEGWFTDTAAGYDLYTLTVPENPKAEVTGTTLRIEPMKPKNKEIEEVVDGIVFTLKHGKTVLYEEHVPYKDWEKPWTCDLSKLTIDKEPLTEDRIGELTLVLQESVAGTYGARDQEPCLGPALEASLSTGFSDELAIADTRLKLSVSGLTITQPGDLQYGKTSSASEDNQVTRIVQATLRKGQSYTIRAESLEQGELIVFANYFDGVNQAMMGRHQLGNTSGTMKLICLKIPGQDNEERPAPGGRTGYIEWTLTPPENAVKINLTMTANKGENGSSTEAFDITIVP